MTTHKISVTVEETRIKVAPERLVMSTKDDVHWQGTNPRRFSIVFDDNGPFGQRELGHAAAISKQQPKARGHFKYSVICEDDPNLSLDPVIVVEEPPTGNP